jgi:hypothetical protein
MGGCVVCGVCVRVCVSNGEGCTRSVQSTVAVEPPRPMLHHPCCPVPSCPPLQHPWLAPSGELFDTLVQEGNLSEDCAKVIIWQALDAVKYLHSLQVVHRDIKVRCEVHRLVSQSTLSPHPRTYLRAPGAWGGSGCAPFVGRVCLGSPTSALPPPPCTPIHPTAREHPALPPQPHGGRTV